MITDELIAKYIVGEAEPHEIAMITQWRKESEANEQQVQQFEMLWKTSANVKDKTKVNVDLAWQKVQERINTVSPKSGRTIPMNTKWLMAASLALLLGIGIVFLNRNIPEKEVMMMANVSMGSKNIQLEDGSKIIVKGGSLSYPKAFMGAQRKVILNKGKAFFDIASNKEKPFVIKAHQTLITVVGTEFEITTESDFTKVVVKEGKVKFTTPNGELFLTAGMGANYTNKTKVLEKISTKSENTFSYVSGQLNFNNATLQQVVSDLNANYENRIVTLENDAIANCKITSSFNHEQLETVLKVIALTLNLEIEHLPDGKTIVLKGKECNQ